MCAFILSFKAYQFLTALVAATSVAYTFYTCLGSEAYLSGTPASCDAMLPTASDSFTTTILLEVPRVLTLLGATLLLRCGYTRGGNGELKALAHVRLDAADGLLDGHVDATALELNSSKVEDKQNSDSVRAVSGATWRKHIQAARDK